MTRAVTLTNTAASSPLSSVTLDTTATVSSILDTNTTNGLQLDVKSCTMAWTQGGTATAPTYTCAGGTVTDLGTTPVVSNRTLAGLNSLKPGGTDHLIFSISLPTAADNALPGQDLDAQPRLHRHPARRRRPLSAPTADVRRPRRRDRRRPAMTAVLPAPRAARRRPRAGRPAATRPAAGGARSARSSASPAAGRCACWCAPPCWPSSGLAVGPHVLDYRTMTMLTGSMAPSIEPGDVVVSTPLDVQTSPRGMVITYHIPIDDHRVVTHRVIEVEHTADGTVSVRTQGDANDAPDPWTAVLTGDTAYQVQAVVPEIGTCSPRCATPP